MPRWQQMSAREKPERYFHEQLTMLALALLAATAFLQRVLSSQIFPEIPPLSFGEPWGSAPRARQMWRIGPFQNVGHVSAWLFDGFDHHQAQRSRLAPFSSDWQRRTAEGNPPPNRCSERWYLGRAQFDLSPLPSFSPDVMCPAKPLLFGPVILGLLRRGPEGPEWQHILPPPARTHAHTRAAALTPQS